MLQSPELMLPRRASQNPVIKMIWLRLFLLQLEISDIRGKYWAIDLTELTILQFSQNYTKQHKYANQNYGSSLSF